MNRALSRLVIDPLDRGTRGPRRRYAEELFWTGRGRRRDRIATRVFFTVSAPMWRARAQEEDHSAPFAAGLDHCRPPARAIDLGTGGGVSAALLAERFPQAEVIGIDDSAAMVRVARAAFAASNLRFECADFRRLPFPDRHFDLVTSLNALPEPAELGRVCSPRAQVLIANTYFPPREGPWLSRLSAVGLRPTASGSACEGGWLLLESA